MGKLNLRFKENEDEKHHENEDEKHHQADDDGVSADHADEEQDKALFAKLIKQYLGKEEPDEMECEMAKQAYQAHKEKGMSHKDAMEAAGKHLQMAAEIGKKMHQAMQAAKQSEAEDEKHEAEDESEMMQSEDEGECGDEKKEAQVSPDKMSPGKKEKKESYSMARLSGEVAKLRESVRHYELKDYLESKLRKSGQSNQCTKLFREALGKPKSKQHIDETWNTFIKAFKAGAEEVSSDDALFVEKNAYRGTAEGKMSFGDCLG